MLPDQNELVLIRVEDLENDIEPGVFGLMEPKIDPTHFAEAQFIDLIIVPGLVFDIFGNRYGYGKGYYDRLLSTVINPPPIKCALCYSQCIVKFELHHQKKDIPMDLLIDESRIYSFH